MSSNDARQACKDGASLSAIASLFKKQAVTTLEPYVKVIQQLTSGGITGDFVSVAFFGFEDGVASSYVLRLHDINILRKGDTSFISGKETEVTKYPVKVELGNTAEIDKFLFMYPRVRWAWQRFDNGRNQ